MNQLATAIINFPKRVIFDTVLKCLSHKNVDPPGLESFLNGGSAQYIEDMYNVWLEDHTKVHASWDAFFRNSGYYPPPTLGSETPVRKEGDDKKKASSVGHGFSPEIETPPNLSVSNAPKNPEIFSREILDFASNKKPFAPVGGITIPVVQPTQATQQAAGAAGGGVDESLIEKHIMVQAIIRGYQVRGHLLAETDPLGRKIKERSPKEGTPPDTISAKYKINEADLDTPFKLPLTTKIGGKENSLPLREILGRLEKTYCDHIGLEYMHINSVEECDWIRERFEVPGAMELSTEKKKLLLTRMARAQLFENFCDKKYPSEKRFGVDGLEAMIPCLKTVIDRGSELGVEMFVIGMSHRGRLNVLSNVCNKSLVHMFAFFEPLKAYEHCSGDVKYHLGTYTERMNRVTNKNVKISLLANPSHLGSGIPAVLGKVRAEQFFRGDTQGKKVMAILIHGDAAFTGQGVYFELLNISNTPTYTTHGTVHVVANNMIGFTTDFRVQGSSPYCTDVARSINAPIFHVNADDPEKVVHIANVAAEWRNTYGRDVVIDLVGYRRYGHQEVDDPHFTHPVLYKQIQQHRPCFEMYADKLIKEKVVTQEEINEIKSQYEKMLEEQFQQAKLEKHIKLKDWLDTPWDAFFQGKSDTTLKKTGVSEETLQHICKAISENPPESAKFSLHKNLQRVLKNRVTLLGNRTVDWAMGEACAYGSLLKEGIHIRMTGEDVERGTFSHRHHVYHHSEINDLTYNPLAHLYPDQAKYVIGNSTLAEYAIMGYEHGYSFVNPNALVIWEAQFGDFSNTAQPIFDQMVSAAEEKWTRQSGFVLLLPHGLEGAGPEHSSARLERMLDMVSEDSSTIPPKGDNSVLQEIKNINWIVTNCTTPANHFHALRRQILLPFRKPIVMLTPKALLRHPEARSSFDDMKEGTEFQRVIDDSGPAGKEPEGVKKVFFSTGKVFYDVRNALREKKLDKEIAMVRIEQLAPFPFDLVMDALKKYGKAKVCWLQEEHKNQGCWDHMEPRFRAMLKALNDNRDICYVGRAVSASPATGFRYKFGAELDQLFENAAKL